MISIFINFIIFFIVGLLIGHIYQVVTKKWALWDQKIGWQFHHSIYGVLIMLLSLVFPQNWVIFLGIGLGVVVEHTLKCGFVFIRRW